MFCGECGTQNPDTNQFCKNCGKPLRRPQQATDPVVQAPITPSATPTIQIPQAPGPVPAQPAPVGTVKPARNWLSIISFLISLVSWLVYPIVIGFIAVVFGGLSLYSARKNHTKIPISAIIAIIIGLLAIILNFFWLDIFPPPESLPPLNFRK